MFQLSSDYVGVSVSEATMRDLDLIQAFNSFLVAVSVAYDDFTYEAKHVIEADRLIDLLVKEDNSELTISDSDADDITWFLNETLFDLMNEIAPDTCYFGSHPGDGADYGFWTHEE